MSRAGSAASASSVALGSFAKAASVGAKTVNGPGPASAASSPVACRSFTSVVKLPAATGRLDDVHRRRRVRDRRRDQHLVDDMDHAVARGDIRRRDDGAVDA